MKKYLRLLLILLAVLLLTACDAPSQNPDDTTDSQSEGTEADTNAGGTEQSTEADNSELPADPNTPVTGSISGFTVFDASRYRTIKSIESSPEWFAIGSYAQWKAYCAAYYPDLLSKYDSAYFDTHSVVVYRKVEGSGSNQLTVRDVQVKNGKLAVTVGRYVPEMGTADVANWCLLIEITGDVVLDEDSDVTVTTVELDQPIA
ncbi:MAG: hypothetical protein IJX62_05795 [Clostridia bacterium]|nr:hypothetical protein [Clostridia bacterium]